MWLLLLISPSTWQAFLLSTDLPPPPPALAWQRNRGGGGSFQHLCRWRWLLLSPGLGEGLLSQRKGRRVSVGLALLGLGRGVMFSPPN